MRTACRFSWPKDRHRFQFAIQLAAEATTERENDHAHVGDGNFENSGELALNNVRVLAAGPYGYPPAADLGHGHVRFERNMVSGRRKKAVLEDPIGITEAPSHVPFALLEQVDDIRSL